LIAENFLIRLSKRRLSRRIIRRNSSAKFESETDPDHWRSADLIEFPATPEPLDPAHPEFNLKMGDPASGSPSKERKISQRDSADARNEVIDTSMTCFGVTRVMQR
jgi:hypothetical protein